MRFIPVVDLRAFTHGDAASRADFVQRFGAGLAEFGFVTLDQHGVPPDLIRRAFDVTARLFALPASALTGQIVLDAGDMLQRATNGVTPSTTHRVVNPSGPNVTRYSMPFFTHPRRPP